MDKEDILVVLPAGGKGIRFRNITNNEFQKTVTKLENKSLIEHVIDLYKDNGFKDFLILVNHLQDSIKEQLKNQNDINIQYSEDPKDIKGKTGALINATKLMKDKKLIIIHNAADIIINNNNFPNEMLEEYNKQNKETAIVGIRKQTKPENMTPVTDNFYHFAITITTKEQIENSKLKISKIYSILTRILTSKKRYLQNL